MKAVVCTSFEGPQALVWKDVDAVLPGPDEVELDVRAAGVNFADVLTVSGKYQVRPPLPFVAGCEASGVVRSVGAGVTTVRPGDRVFAFTTHGAYAERLVVGERMVRRIPNELSFEGAAAFAVTYGTAHLGLVHRAGLKRGETLVVTGAGGGVGIAAVELGKALGARVVAVVSSADKALLATKAGADAVIDLSVDADLRAGLRKHAPSGVDVALDNVGGPGFEVLVRSLGWGGRVLVVGFASGAIPELKANLLLLKNASAIGVYWGMSFVAEPDAIDRSFAALFDLVKAGAIRPAAHLVAPMSKAGDALSLLEARKSVGKVVLVP